MFVTTDVVEVALVGCSVTDRYGLAHGAATWVITAPRFTVREFGVEVAALTPATTVVGPVFHETGLGCVEVAEVAARAWERLCARGVPEAEAAVVLPDCVHVRYVLTMTARQLGVHLHGADRHSEPMRTLDRGLMTTLADHAPETAVQLAAMLPDGVFPAPFGQEETTGQEAS